MKGVAAALLVSLPVGAAAQGLPRIEPGAGYEIEQMLGDGNALVRSDGRQFLCGIEPYEGAAWRLGSCQPFVTSDEVDAAASVTADLTEREAAAIRRLGMMPPQVFDAALTAAIETLGCTLDTGDADALFADLARAVGAELDMPVDGPAGEAMLVPLEARLDAMEGAFVINEDAGTATFTGGTCRGR